MKRLLLSLFTVLSVVTVHSQTNLLLTNPVMEDLLKGNYPADTYEPATLINHPDAIFADLVESVSPDSLYDYLVELSNFENRNTGADTTSATFGMGAARRWAHSKFENFPAAQEGRLEVGYFQFDQDICGMGQHRNVLAVLPGIGPDRGEVVLLEGHMDSRCAEVCDTGCMAHGMEDNATGTALVLELARVMSQYAFNRTIVFMITTGEEQGLFGANAFAEYAEQENIQIRGVYNNDIVGGIICGATASPPGCPGLNAIDSINVRVYSSNGGLFGASSSRLLARYSKLQYDENIAPIVPVAAEVNIISREDRAGRGGDHIPFRQRGYSAVRFTSANEHGNGNPSTPDYHDRQHTMEDILGVDTDDDGQIDSFFVDFNYLARNTVLNGSAAAASAMGPATPTNFELEATLAGVRYKFEDAAGTGLYRLGIRSFETETAYFDTLVTVTALEDTLSWLPPGTVYLMSAAALDSNNIESHFSEETFANLTTSTQEVKTYEGLTLLQNRPNPFDEATTIGVMVESPIDYNTAFIRIADTQGRELARYEVELNPGLVQVVYGYENHRYTPGTYYYSLVIDGRPVDTKAMIYAY
jgi:hypothetical protein